MTASNSAPNHTAYDRREAIRRHWILFLIQGLILNVLGLLAIGEPMVATLAVALFAGWLFMISGILGLIGTVRAGGMSVFWWSFLRRSRAARCAGRSARPHRRAASAGSLRPFASERD